MFIPLKRDDDDDVLATGRASRHFELEINGEVVNEHVVDIEDIFRPLFGDHGLIEVAGGAVEVLEDYPDVLDGEP
ncbi:MAG: hypothetical protein WB615_05315 [Candidatus Tumulicola sp.]